MSISLLLMLVVLSTQHNTGHAVSPCAFDAASISSIEKWWKGDGDLLRNMDLHCLSKTAGQIGGGVVSFMRNPISNIKLNIHVRFFFPYLTLSLFSLSYTTFRDCLASLFDAGRCCGRFNVGWLVGKKVR
jgi:hypothetical protein